MISTRGLSADVSAGILINKLRAHDPFIFLRYGDGALECLQGKEGGTCDGERYSGSLGADLYRSILAVRASPLLYLGDWQSASFADHDQYARYRDQYEALFAPVINWLHFETLLLMRESEALVNFYYAVKHDRRKKLFMGPEACWGAAKMLNADFLATPLTDLHQLEAGYTRYLLKHDFDILLYGAGMAGTIPVVNCWKQYPDRTYINLGSAMDPLFRGRTRQQQLSPEAARALFEDLL